MRNKKILGALLAVTTLVTFGLAGCGNSDSNGASSKEDDKTITVAASPTPHAEILNKAVKPLVEKDGTSWSSRNSPTTCSRTPPPKRARSTRTTSSTSRISTTSTRRRAPIWCPWRESTSSRSACIRARPRLWTTFRTAPPWPCRTTPPTKPARFCSCRTPV